MKLIDTLEQALIKANIKYNRDSWIEPVRYKKPTVESWIDIHLPTEDPLKQLHVHIFFKHGARVLEHIKVYNVEHEVVEKTIEQLTL